MIDPQQFLIPLDAKRALLLSDSEFGLEELEGLLATMGGFAEEKLKLPHRKPDSGTYLGAGKLDEVAKILEAKNLDLLLVDFDLSPSQLRNIEKVLQAERQRDGKTLVLDRSGIILEIFNRHARTKESKLQVELARLQYLMPRLTNLWSHFERQRGSGGGALKGKGMGEKQIEVDRRMVKERVDLLKRKLKEVEKSRRLHRAHRESMLKVALVGYTNAGKSTLLNALTHSEVLVEDALFATLDASVRLLNPKIRPAILAIDTVGFIDRLPHALVASFRSTLGEVLEADLLLHVIDASHVESQRQHDVTVSVLEQLGAANIPRLLVLNKIDLCGKPGKNSMGMIKVWAAGVAREHSLPAPLFLSALDPKAVTQLRDAIAAFFDRGMETYEIVVPFEDGKTAAKLHEVGRVESTRPTPKGTFFRVRTTAEFAGRLNLDRYRV